MEYMDLVRDFARRTRSNLDFLTAAQRSDPAASIYEVTHLINSLLGLLVFPQQKYVEGIPQTPLSELAARGWPIPRIVGEYPQAPNLRELVRMLRHSIAHFNIMFKSDKDGQINGLTLWNINPRTGNMTWQAELTVTEIESLARRFVKLLLNEDDRATANPSS